MGSEGLAPVARTTQKQNPEWWASGLGGWMASLQTQGSSWTEAAGLLRVSS